MNEPTEQFSRDLKAITLSSLEREGIRSALQAVVRSTPEYPPVRAFAMRHVFAFSLGAFVLLATGTTALAQQSLPGDFLYPIRLAVNDRFSVALAGDEEARLDREFDQMDRTLDEEELVAAHELASLAVEVDLDVQAADTSSEPGEDAPAGVDVELDAEIRSLERLLDQEESAAELELSL